MANCVYKGTKFNMLDVPGFFDFEGEFVQAMAVADGALVVTGAGGSLTVGTEKALDYCVEHKIPTMIFVSDMDKENSNYFTTVEAIQQKYGNRIAPLMIPEMVGGKFKGYANIADGKYDAIGSHGENGQDIPASIADKFAEVSATVQEKAAESDEELMMEFFDKGELSAEQIVAGIKAGICDGSAIGVFGGSGLANQGVFNLMNNLIGFMPSPADVRPLNVRDEKGAEVTVVADDKAPVVLRIFKTIVDPFVGRLNLFKVLSGTLKSGNVLKNVNKDSDEKISSIYFLFYHNNNRRIRKLLKMFTYTFRRLFQQTGIF